MSPEISNKLLTLEMDHRAILRGIWRRHKLLMLCVFFGLTLPAIVLLYYISRPVYVSQTTISVEPTMLDQMPQFREFTRRDSVATVLVLLRSVPFAELVVDALPRESFDEFIG